MTGSLVGFAHELPTCGCFLSISREPSPLASRLRGATEKWCQINGRSLSVVPQWRNEAPGTPAMPGGADIGGRQIVIKMWDNFARLTALLAKVRIWFNNSTIYLDFSDIFSEIAQSKLVTKGRH